MRPLQFLACCALLALSHAASAQAFRNQQPASCTTNVSELVVPVLVGNPAGTSIVVSIAYTFPPLVQPAAHVTSSHGQTFAPAGGNTTASYTMGSWYVELDAPLGPGDSITVSFAPYTVPKLCTHVAAYDGISMATGTGDRWNNTDFYIKDHYVTTYPDEVPAGVLMHAVFVYPGYPGSPIDAEPPATALSHACLPLDSSLCIHTAYLVTTLPGITAIATHTFTEVDSGSYLQAFRPRAALFGNGFE